MISAISTDSEEKPKLQKKSNNYDFEHMLKKARNMFR